ncbi:MAG: nucleoside triphosphate pyrophosphohydrolase [Spirochaetes bacterium]|nr:nucleoside triphosphate pyrophosphohydrolase [Spirochaetota bacterium]
MHNDFAELVRIMARLRGENGCAWDKEQTYDTIRPYLLEETYEVIETILDKNFEGLKEELGDLLLQVVFLSQIAADEKRFSIDDVVRTINEKLIRRHPHVFGDEETNDTNVILKKWEDIKKKEKADKNIEHKSILDGVPKILPALTQAHKIQGKAKRVGFDFPDHHEAFKKVHEEVTELEEELNAGEQNANRIEEEIGDLLFAVTNVARMLSIDAEGALMKANRKFRSRFSGIEDHFAKKGKDLTSVTLAEMDAVWEEQKRA